VATPSIHIGTSGWHYGHWVGPFYPPGMRSPDFLGYYSRRFRAVEINNTFYRMPDPQVMATWRDATPRDFVFACKANRYVTHMKKLRDPGRSLPGFFSAVDSLGTKLGPILFQLPPRWRVDGPRLRAFLEALPIGRRYAFEFRDRSWFVPEVYQALADHNAALCAYDLGGFRSPIESTADFAYVRLHGPNGNYRGRYDGRTLFGWVRRFLDWAGQGRRVYCFFDNDERGYAATDALHMLRLIARHGGGEADR
jgi:uncharacterized protein YecE (DUF72 family)